jgi:nitrate reductase delta subunit
MKIMKMLSCLLLYPEAELIDALPELQAGLAINSTLYGRLRPLLGYLAQHDLIALQQNYVQTFDRNPGHSLHLFEHIHGESRDRGQAMVDLLQEYQRHGLQMCADDLPDYVPLFLEFLSTLEDSADSARLLGDAIHVLAHIGNKLAAGNSPYACVFDVLQSLSPVLAEPLADPPVRDMDEALETFGPGMDGVEPLLKPGMAGASGGVQPITFYPKSAYLPASAASAASATMKRTSISQPSNRSA